MRPAGEVRQALIQAARELAQSGRGATLAELADKACVGREAARMHVPKLKSRGHLQIVCERRVAYRNRPVAEYAPAKLVTADDGPVMSGAAVLSHCMQGWIR